MSEIALTATQRETLLSLQQTTQLFSQTNERLNTNKKVNSATDDAVAYFRSQSLYQRATDLTTRKSTIDQNVQALNAAVTATSAVETMMQELKGILDNARSATGSQAAAATKQFSDIATQMAQLITDTTYQGVNLLSSSNASLVTQFSERTAATYTIAGYNLIESGSGNSRALFTQANAVFTAQGAVKFSQMVGDSAGTGGSPVFGVKSFSQLNISASPGSTIPGSQAAAIFNATENRLSQAIDQLQSITASLGTNVAILQARIGFSTDYANVLTDGGDQLTLADLNTEAANEQALELRQQLGIQSLSISGQQNQSILQLLK